MQKIILIGNLTREPELTETASGIAICRFSIAVNRSYADKDGERKTDFFNVTAWRGLGENVAKYCHKGNKVAVEGELQINSYERKDGKKGTNVDVMAQSVEFLTSPNKDGDGAQRGAQSAQGGRRERLQSFDDDDIPF